MGERVRAREINEKIKNIKIKVIFFISLLVLNKNDLILKNFCIKNSFYDTILLEVKMENLKVLIADDEKPLAEAIREILNHEGRQVKVAYTLKKAKEIIEEEGADLIISDICFNEEEDGFTLAKWVKEKGYSNEIVFISGYGNTDMEKKSRAEGAFRFFHKPLDFDILEKLVENIENRLKEGKINGLNIKEIGGTITDVEAKKLQEAYLTGNEDALEKLLEGYKNLIFSVGRKWYGLNKEDLEDLYQDVCMEVMVKISRIKNIRTFIIGTTMNMARKMLSKNGKYVQAKESINKNILEFSPEKQAMKEDTQKALNKAMDILEPKMKNLVWALFVENMSYKEISEKFNIPIGSIGPTRLKIVKKLKEFLVSNNQTI